MPKGDSSSGGKGNRIDTYGLEIWYSGGDSWRWKGIYIHWTQRRWSPCKNVDICPKVAEEVDQEMNAYLKKGEVAKQVARQRFMIWLIHDLILEVAHP